MSIGSFSILVHSETRVADRIAGSREFLRVFCIAQIERNYGFSIVNVFHHIIDRFHVIALIAQESTLLNGQGAVGSGEDFLNNGGIRHIGGSSQLIKGQTGNAVYQHVISYPQ